MCALHQPDTCTTSTDPLPTWQCEEDERAYSVQILIEISTHIFGTREASFRNELIGA